MSEPAVYVLIRDGQPRFYGDRWGGVFLFRELVWGPDDFEAWATQQYELDRFEDDMNGGVVVNYDTKQLVWSDSAEHLAVPAKHAAYTRLLAAAWPGFAIHFADDVSDLAQAASIERETHDDDEEADDDYRIENIAQAARQYDDDDDDEEDDGDTFGSEETRAWVTLIDENGGLRQYQLETLPTDLLYNREPIAAVAALEPAQVPAEAVVAEGFWIDVPGKAIGCWGNADLRKRLDRIDTSWNDWQVTWAEGAYSQHCEATRSPGIPLSEAKALAGMLPIILSTKRLDLNTFLTGIGGGIKTFAIKATGCLVSLICLPMLLFGALTGEWTAVGISCGFVVLLAVVAFKVAEYRLRRSVTDNLPQRDKERETPPVAGPLDESVRRERIASLLISAGLPKFAEIEPMFESCELDAFD